MLGRRQGSLCVRRPASAEGDGPAAAAVARPPRRDRRESRGNAMSTARERRKGRAQTTAREVPGAIQWHEGMLLAPQHFQWLSLRQETLLQYHASAISPFHWGV